MKPERSSEGRKKNIVICIACIWLLASVEKVKPMARLVAMKRMRRVERSTRLPTMGTSKRNLAAGEDHDHLDVAHHDVWTILPSITSSGRTGVASRFSMVPRSRSRVIAMEVIITSVMVSTTPMSPGTMLYWVMPSGL
jgi:hypothetical protein